MPEPGTKPRQVAAIPLRASDSGTRVCLIRRKGSAKWGVPKGFIDPGDTPEQAALTEAHEEAGLDGKIVGGRIGTYDYKKNDVVLTVAVFLMRVVKEESTWPEMGFRERRWCSIKEARALLKSHGVRRLLDRVRF